MKYKDGDAKGVLFRRRRTKIHKIYQFQEIVFQINVKIYNDQNKFIGKRCLKGTNEK